MIGILEEVLEEIPVAVVKPAITLLAGLVRVLRAGDDPEARFNALMRTAEDLKREADDAKFGPRG